RTVLFVSHNMTAITRLTRRCLVLDEGRIVFDGEPRVATRHYIGLKQQQSTAGRRPISDIAVMRRFRASPQVVISEMGFAADQSLSVAVGESLRLEFIVEADSDYAWPRIAYSINDAAGGPLLTGLTAEFHVRRGR